MNAGVDDNLPLVMRSRRLPRRRAIWSKASTNTTCRSLPWRAHRAFWSSSTGSTSDGNRAHLGQRGHFPEPASLRTAIPDIRSNPRGLLIYRNCWASILLELIRNESSKTLKAVGSEIRWRKNSELNTKCCPMRQRLRQRQPNNLPRQRKRPWRTRPGPHRHQRRVHAEGSISIAGDPSQPWRARMPWDNLELFWVDERCVPPDDADSNYRMTREAMLDHVPLKPEQIHRMEGELDPQAAAARYESLLRNSFRAGGRGKSAIRSCGAGHGPRRAHGFAVPSYRGAA